MLVLRLNGMIALIYKDPLSRLLRSMFMCTRLEVKANSLLENFTPKTVTAKLSPEKKRGACLSDDEQCSVNSAQMTTLEAERDSGLQL